MFRITDKLYSVREYIRINPQAQKPNGGDVTHAYTVIYVPCTAQCRKRMPKMLGLFSQIGFGL